MFTRTLETKRIKGARLRRKQKYKANQTQSGAMSLQDVMDFNRTNYKRLSTSRENKTDFISTGERKTSSSWKLYQKTKERAITDRTQLSSTLYKWATKTFHHPSKLKINFADTARLSKKFQHENDYLGKSKLEIDEIGKITVKL